VEKGDGGFESTVADSSIDYQYEGITCIGEEVWAVGFKSPFAPADLPTGVIRHTKDGVNWETQTIPVNDAGLWKVSFAGPRSGSCLCSILRWLADRITSGLAAVY
jgi:hypothetical protein